MYKLTTVSSNRFRATAKHSAMISANGQIVMAYGNHPTTAIRNVQAKARKLKVIV